MPASPQVMSCTCNPLAWPHHSFASQVVTYMTQTAPIRLISPTWIVPVIPAGVVLENHSLVVAGQHILALLPTPEALLA